MARIPLIENKEQLPPEHHITYDAIAQSRGVVRGPFAVLLHSPDLAGRTAHLGGYIRFESKLDPRIVELAALASARELDCKHEWAAHVAQAAKAGVSRETMRALQQRKTPENFSFEDAQIVSCAQELLRTHRLSEATFQALYARLGEQGLVELTATIGYYAMLACTLNAFDVASVEPPEDLKI
ncbi:MAG TPA: carboxymuconolactone decarboxylase family protein [Candidatus Binatia bacterium]|jgi:4-carboxymuconolactone decarboxylase